MISAADLAFRYNAVLTMLPQLTIRCTPNMSTAEIARVTNELQVYVGSRPEILFEESTSPASRAVCARAVVLQNVVWSGCFIKRTLKGAK